ncbi:6-phosphogluconolactonase [Sphingomonas morindae]|uniref:6-phosphogluconolactonase n=1 Tax=Sphingomonas morindae TaxID=1541170 RepID=A0ABY4XBY9_9SPHN|nr:6-phosphogluconolactonase [Sphingomonas morindae]USI74399.1 6-phosphogluconolactonase [Sphingomonas morindae]
MIEAEWWDYDTAEELAEAVAGDIGFIIESAIDARGDCVLALPGGKSPIPVFEKLKTQKFPWKRVTIVPGDDRLVAVDDPLSNAGLLARHFLPLGARVVPLASEKLGVRQAGEAADARLSDLHWPLDLVWLGMGTNGHTASIFHGPDYDEALGSKKRAIGLTPDPLPPEAPVARVTLTRSAIVQARTILVTIDGAEKKRVLEEALAQGEASEWPIGRVLAEAEQAIDIHWRRA